MFRTCVCSLIGAAAGFGLGCVLIAFASGGRPAATDTAAVTVFLGSLLAVGGAIAGAITGGAADLIEYLRRRDAIARIAEPPNSSGSN